MKTLSRDKYLTKLSILFGASYEDVQAWFEEILQDDFIFHFAWSGFEEIKECMLDYQVKEFTTMLVEHFEKENELNIEEIIKIVEKIKIATV